MIWVAGKLLYYNMLVVESTFVPFITVLNRDFSSAGLIWVEIKQLWDVGIYEYLHDMWNFLDFITNSLYIAVIILRLVAFWQVL